MSFDTYGDDNRDEDQKAQQKEGHHCDNSTIRKCYNDDEISRKGLRVEVLPVSSAIVIMT